MERSRRSEGRVREAVVRRLGLSVSNDYALLEAIGGDCAGAPRTHILLLAGKADAHDKNLSLSLSLSFVASTAALPGSRRSLTWSARWFARGSSVTRRWASVANAIPGRWRDATGKRWPAQSVWVRAWYCVRSSG